MDRDRAFVKHFMQAKAHIEWRLFDLADPEWWVEKEKQGEEDMQIEEERQVEGVRQAEVDHDE